MPTVLSDDSGGADIARDSLDHHRLQTVHHMGPRPFTQIDGSATAQRRPYLKIPPTLTGTRNRLLLDCSLRLLATLDTTITTG